MKLLLTSLQMAVLAAALTACASSTPLAPPTEPASDFVACPSQRPQVCTRDYRPVCAQRDTGVRCVTTPCPSTEWVTRPNACSACGDAKVYGYKPGACR